MADNQDRLKKMRDALTLVQEARHLLHDAGVPSMAEALDVVFAAVTRYVESVDLTGGPKGVDAKVTFRGPTDGAKKPG